MPTGDEVDNGPKPGMAAVGFSALVEGPRTKVTLSNVVVHIGKADVDPRGELVLDFFGGPLPDGTFLFLAGAPRLEHWGRGMFFLAPGRWFDRPVLPSQQLYLSASLNHHTHSPAYQAWASSPHPFLPPHWVFTSEVTATVPCGIPTGTYHVYHGVDYTQSWAEAVEDNNIVRTGRRITVLNCGC